MTKTDTTYLNDLLGSQAISDDSQEMKNLRAQRDEVETLIKATFPTGKIRYGGSKAKGTMIKESYDLDLVCYFPHDETAAGATLKDLYKNVSKKLADKYIVQEKTSAIRLLSAQEATKGTYTHVDVVPGRYTDSTNSDCYLYQNGGDKERLKTNLDTHISHIRDSALTDALKLLKLWRVLNGINVKQFAFELLGVDILKDKKNAVLSDQLQHFFETVSKAEKPITVEDPANPTGNDLMPLLSSAWPHLQSLATQTIDTIQTTGWDSVFGKSDSAENSPIHQQLSAAIHVAQQHQPTKPWSAYSLYTTLV